VPANRLMAVAAATCETRRKDVDRLLGPSPLFGSLDRIHSADGVITRGAIGPRDCPIWLTSERRRVTRGGQPPLCREQYGRLGVGSVRDGGTARPDSFAPIL
jgi:hypothetical protein